MFIWNLHKEKNEEKFISIKIMKRNVLYSFNFLIRNIFLWFPRHIISLRHTGTLKMFVWFSLDYKAPSRLHVALRP